MALGESLKGAADALGSVAAPSMNGILGTLTTLATCCVPVGILAWMTGGEKEKPETRIQTPRLEHARAYFTPPADLRARPA